MFKIQKVQYFGFRKDLKRGADSAPPDQNGTITNFQVFNNFALSPQKIEQRLTQTQNNADISSSWNVGNVKNPDFYV